MEDGATNILFLSAGLRTILYKFEEFEDGIMAYVLYGRVRAKG